MYAPASAPSTKRSLSDKHGEELGKLNRGRLFENFRIISKAKSLRSVFPRRPVEVGQHPALRIRSLDEVQSGLRPLTRRMIQGKCKARSLKNRKEGRESTELCSE